MIIAIALQLIGIAIYSNQSCWARKACDDLFVFQLANYNIKF